MKKHFYEWYKTAEAHIYETSPPKICQRNFNSWQAQFELYYISARGNHVYDTTLDWFKREEIPYDHIELIGSHYKIETAKKHRRSCIF